MELAVPAREMSKPVIWSYARNVATSVPFCRAIRTPMSTEVESDPRHPSQAESSFETDSSPGRFTAAEAGRSGPLLLFFAAAIACILWSCASYFRWANFGYRTFDLAYYVQAVWQLIHGRFSLTIENVPLLGNHVEPIVFLFAPIFALVRHPMVFVIVQSVALSSMAPLGYLLGCRFFDGRTSVLLSLALLLAPATSFVALHEFHPEALSAPLLLLMLYARTTGRLWLHWFGFLAVLACKENMALLLAAYCAVLLVIEWDRGLAALVRWYIVPLVVAMTWFLLCTQFITPAFNSGNIDYLSLYSRLGKSAGEIVGNAITRPQLIGRALTQSLMHGNLVWGLLLPFCGLPLLRPRWLLISAPIFVQHLLSWRSSEWTIYFHYAAPLLPLMWIAAVEAIAVFRDRRYAAAPAMVGRSSASPGPNGVAGAPGSGVVTAIAPVLVLACIAGQIWIGPARTMVSELAAYGRDPADRARKEAFIGKIPATASVVAPLPYLSHLAMREKLYSLHYILKGLKTLSRERYQLPPPADFVLIDYNDAATFDAGAGYYHPQMRTVDGSIVPSSDQLLHEFLGQGRWTAESIDELTLFKNTSAEETQSSAVDIRPPESATTAPVFSVGGNELQAVNQLHTTDQWNLELRWLVSSEREAFPWMILRLSKSDSQVKTWTKGLCAIDVKSGTATEHWRVDLSKLPAGEYEAEAIFLDNTKRAWRETHGGGSGSDLLAPPISLGRMTLPVSPP